MAYFVAYFLLVMNRFNPIALRMAKILRSFGCSHTCDKFQSGIREVFLSFPGGFLKLYRIYKNILHSFQGDFKISVKSDIFLKNFMAHFLESPG